jgi:hypothetical protein
MKIEIKIEYMDDVEFVSFLFFNNQNINKQTIHFTNDGVLFYNEILDSVQRKTMGSYRKFIKTCNLCLNESI